MALAVFVHCGAFSILAQPNVDWPLQVKRPPALDARTYDFTRVSGSGASGALTSAGAVTITLRPCPYGLNGSDTAHYVYISGGVGTAEAVLITGGTCTSGAVAGGTITATTANTHSGAWQVDSASDGIAEAVIAAGNYGAVRLTSGTFEIYAPIRISYRVSLLGNGFDETYLHNNSATTGVINYTALTPSGDQDTFGGAVFSGFTIYSGAKTNTAVNTTVADAVYVLGTGWNFTMRDVMIRNHSTGVHQVNGWSSNYDAVSVRYFRDYGFLTETDETVGTGTEAGPGAGGDQFILNSKISNVGATGTPTSTGCAIRYARWSGLYLTRVSVTATPWGLCLKPRALRGPETFTQVYYGEVIGSHFDTTENGGILLDTTEAGTTNTVSSIDFIGVKSAYNGCLQSQASSCTGVPFANAAHGVYLNAASGSNIRDIKFIGGEFRENGGHGLTTSANAYVNTIAVIGVHADNNSQAADNTYDGFHFENGNFQITLQGSTAGSMNSNLTRHPRYGFYGGTSLTQFTVTGNTFYPLNGGALNPTPCSYNSSSLLNSLMNNLPFDSTCNPTFNILPGFGPLTSYDFASLPSANNGTMIYCTNCNSTCTGSGGTGRTCFREAGAWTH